MNNRRKLIMIKSTNYDHELYMNSILSEDKYEGVSEWLLHSDTPSTELMDRDSISFIPSRNPSW